MRNRMVVAATLPLVALLLSACSSRDDYNKLAERNQQLMTDNQQLATDNQQLAQENQQLQSQLTSLQQQHKWVEAGDLLFPTGSWNLSPAGTAALDELVPRLHDLKNAKIVVYGYTDDTPVGPTLQRQGVANNLDLSSKRAGAVVTYFASQGVDPGIMSAKGRGDTQPVASNDTPEDRAKNRRIEIILEGPGA